MGKCHMYGLGVYLADLAQKSHRYVREPSCGDHSIAPRRSYAWQTMLGGRFRDFEEEFQEMFEDAHQQGKRVLRFSARGWSYDLDFERMLQVNLSTGRERPVQRVELSLDDSAQTDIAVPPPPPPYGGARVYSMLRCRVLLGNPYLIEGNLLSGSAMHDMCWCQNPSDALETSAEDWSISKGHDSFYVRGLAGAQKAGLGVYNNEYVVFHPYQILPVYQVDYIVE